MADRSNGVFLTNDAFVQLSFHVEQFCSFFFGEFVDRDARPDTQHFGDCLFVYLVVQVDALGFDVCLFLGALIQQGAFLVTQFSGFFKALVFDCLLLGSLDIFDFVFNFFQVRRGLHTHDAQTAAGFVNEIDCLIRQEAVRDVAIGHVGCGDECLVGDGHPVVAFVLVADALQDFNRVRHRWLVNFYRLEASLEGGIFFEVLAEFVERGGTDGLQFSAGKHWLQD